MIYDLIHLFVLLVSTIVVLVLLLLVLFIIVAFVFFVVVLLLAVLNDELVDLFGADQTLPRRLTTTCKLTVNFPITI